jgi:hypothetical protein
MSIADRRTEPGSDESAPRDELLAVAGEVIGGPPWRGTPWTLKLTEIPSGHLDVRAA